MAGWPRPSLLRSGPHLWTLSSFLCCIFSYQVDACTLVVPTRGLGELLEREGPPESWFSTFDQSASLIFVGFYGAGPVFEGGYVISAFRMALVVEKKVASNILSS